MPIVEAEDVEAEDVEAEDVEAEGSGVRIGQVVATAATVVGVLSAIVVLPLGKLLVLGLLAAALLPWVAVFLRPAWGPLKYVLACALTVALTAFSLTLIYYQSHPAKNSGPKSQPPPPRDRPVSRLKFLPEAGPIPHCVNFAGTGSIPAHHALVLFDRATDSAGHYTPTSKFSYDGQAAPSSTGWTAPQRNIGSGDASDQDGHIAIVAVLMPQETADFLAILASSFDNGHLPSNVTSLGATADRLIVTRNAQNAHC